MYYLILRFVLSGDRALILKSPDDHKLCEAADALESFLGPDFSCEVLDSFEYENSRGACGELLAAVDIPAIRTPVVDKNII